MTSKKLNSETKVSYSVKAVESRQAVGNWGDSNDTRTRFMFNETESALTDKLVESGINFSVTSRRNTWYTAKHMIDGDSDNNAFGVNECYRKIAFHKDGDKHDFLESWTHRDKDKGKFTDTCVAVDLYETLAKKFPSVESYRKYHKGYKDSQYSTYQNRVFNLSDAESVVFIRLILSLLDAHPEITWDSCETNKHWDDSHKESEK